MDESTLYEQARQQIEQSRKIQADKFTARYGYIIALVLIACMVPLILGMIEGEDVAVYASFFIAILVLTILKCVEIVSARKNVKAWKAKQVARRLMKVERQNKELDL